MEAEGNQRKTCNHSANYCQQQNELITQECRRRTASAPYVPVGNQHSIAGVSIAINGTHPRGQCPQAYRVRNPDEANNPAVMRNPDYVQVRILVFIVFGH